MINLMMYVIEDDKKLSSSFFNDFKFLLSSYREYPDIKIHIIYHSVTYFGDMKIDFCKDHVKIQNIDSITNRKNIHDFVKVELDELYKQYYSKEDTNILVLSGHTRYYFSDEKWKETDIFSGLSDIDLLILDICYSSYYDMLINVIDRARYVIATETTSPNFGMVGKRFLGYVYRGNYTKIIDDFIKRNEIIDPRLKYRTDGVLIDMLKFKEVVNYLEVLSFGLKNKKYRKCRIDRSPGYYFYDLVCLSDVNRDTKLKKILDDCILYQKMNELGLAYVKKYGIRMNGVSVHV